MWRPTLAVVLALPLAACRASSPAAAEPPGTAGDGVAGTPEGEDEHAFDLEGFEPPFGRIPLGEAFVRAHGLRKVILHEDVDTEDARLVDAEVTAFDYDREGRLLSAVTHVRGELHEETRYEHVDGRLAAEASVRPDGTQRAIRYHYDAAGRVQRVEHRLPYRAIAEHHAYDEHGRPSVVTHVEEDRRAEQRFFYEDERLRRVVLRTPDGRELTTEHHYDAAGRPTRRVTRHSTGRVDTYELTWDARGRLRAVAFTEDDQPIYRRTYAYDEDGRPLREELESFVSAMGRGTVVRYEYERHGELPRESGTAKRPRHDQAELLAVTVAAFHGAYEELAMVTHESHGDGNFALASVTVYIPEAIVRERSEAELRQQACEVKQALDSTCDCEYVTLGEPQDMALHSWPDKRVVPLTLHLMLAC